MHTYPCPECVICYNVYVKLDVTLMYSSMVILYSTLGTEGIEFPNNK